MYPLDNPVEIVWTIITSVGAFFASYSVVDAYRDYRTTRVDDGKPEILALGSLRNESVFFVLQFIFFLVGLLAVLDPTPAIDISPLRYVVAGMFIALAFLLTANSIINRTVRKALLVKDKK